MAARVDTAEPTDDWLADVRAAATALYRAVREHPAAVPLVLTRRTSSPAALAPAEALAAALARGGLDGPDLPAAFRAVMAFVMGVAQAELAGPLAPGGDAAQASGSRRRPRRGPTAHPRPAGGPDYAALRRGVHPRPGIRARRTPGRTVAQG
ncbi:TetR/AcrR family transcriptional regulator C-terminal domain-containing protein [Streptomyces sulfonofaciens]|uniref:TetR/AcrR family transcriptional regulator C-terminal domain-containing protein n=1 Tax=Streptomyces sulfonofaciens TaxID=68272 RepID=UPI001E34FE50|nr:TetR/AcrR family transcriptional regulator C-terminal domain-containing protein [Streptomyces sulfonofaciens]